MSETMVGQKAPAFRLPAAQGDEIGLEDYRGRKNLVMFFAKGMACGFCRQNMSQLARGYPRFREVDAEILQVAPTTPARGQFYARNFQLPFPYLCDPDYAAYRAYGLTIRAHSLLQRAMGFLAAARLPHPTSDLPDVRPALSELGHLTKDDDMGLFVIDKAGIIRAARTGSYVLVEKGRLVGARSVPSADEIVRDLERCQGG